MPNKNLTERSEFKALLAHRQETGILRMQELFAADKDRFKKFHTEENGLLLDFSRHLVTDKTMALLVDLARACDVEGWRRKMFAGEIINTSENRAVLHGALRGSTAENLTVDGENVAGFVRETLARVKTFSDHIRRKKKYTDIVSIGIGGSDLGARTVCEALAPFADGPRVYFVANIDGAVMDGLLKKLNPRKTLFIIISKTFSTLETLSNAQAAKAWAGKAGNFAAVTENEKAAAAFGIAPEYIFPMRPWIGGRFSVWSAAGLPVALSIGFENFQKLLGGAKLMDQHFLTAPLAKNMPVIMALLGIWYRNCHDFRAHAVIPYAENLKAFITYLQQIDMESNGKSVNFDGEALDYETGPVIFGEPGTNAQHAFFQLLHQGTDIIPCDFIIAAKAGHGLKDHHIKLNANALAQAKGLMTGEENKAEPHRNYAGNRPSSMIVLNQLDAHHLGMLMALYEHKTFVQGVLWNINGFDQWGVELGKIISKDIVQALENKIESRNLDSAAAALVSRLKTHI